MKAALEDLRGVIAQVSEKRFATSTEREDIRRVFVLLFIFDQMAQNLRDLADRARELRRTGRSARRKSFHRVKLSSC